LHTHFNISTMMPNVCTHHAQGISISNTYIMATWWIEITPLEDTSVHNSLVYFQTHQKSSYLNSSRIAGLPSELGTMLLGMWTNYEWSSVNKDIGDTWRPLDWHHIQQEIVHLPCYLNSSVKIWILLNGVNPCKFGLKKKVSLTSTS
jgi:hypothetical protein